MDGFTGFKTAAAGELPDAVAVMDPSHVVRLAGDVLDQCRRRVQQDLHGHRGRKDDRSTWPGGPCTPAPAC
jgi:transposase